MSSFTRASPRYAVALSVRVRCETWPEYLELHTSDLSRGGVFVATPVSAPVGTEVLVILALPTGAELQLRAEIVHVFADDHAVEASARRFGLGLMFTVLDDATRATLETTLALARAGGAPAPAVVPVAPAAPAPTRRPVAPRTPLFDDVIAKALLAELARRAGLTAHQQLGVLVDARADEIDEAYKQLAERYHPTIFESYGDETRRTVAELSKLLHHAHEELRDPEARRRRLEGLQEPLVIGPTDREREHEHRAEELRRSLRITIDLRLEEARRLRDTGQLEAAIRVFEAALMLDRQNATLRAELTEVRTRHQAELDARPGRSLIDRFRKR